MMFLIRRTGRRTKSRMWAIGASNDAWLRQELAAGRNIRELFMVLRTTHNWSIYLWELHARAVDLGALPAPTKLQGRYDWDALEPQIAVLLKENLDWQSIDLLLGIRTRGTAREHWTRKEDKQRADAEAEVKARAVQEAARRCGPYELDPTHEIAGVAKGHRRHVLRPRTEEPTTVWYIEAVLVRADGAFAPNAGWNFKAGATIEANPVTGRWNWSSTRASDNTQLRGEALTEHDARAEVLRLYDTNEYKDQFEQARKRQKLATVEWD